MYEYKTIAMEAMELHASIAQQKKIMQAIISTLIGAFASGKDVSILSFDENKLKGIDLTKNIEIFKEANKSVESLENALADSKINTENFIKLFNEKNGIIKQHYFMSPKSFMKKYFIINGEELMNILKTDTLNHLLTKKDQINFNIVGRGEYVMVFFNENDDLYKLKKFISKNNHKLSYHIQEFKITKTDEDIISYLYKK